MSEVKQVIVTTKELSRQFPLGQIAYGFYTVEGDALTMTDRDGKPAEDGTGKKYTHKLKPGEDAKFIASKLTKELRLALRGKNAPVSGFGSPIRYPKNTGFI